MPCAENSKTRLIQRSAMRLMWATCARMAAEKGEVEKVRHYVEKLLILEQDAIQHWEQRLGGGVDNKIKKLSKKRSLNRLPKDWRVQFLDRAAQCRGNKPAKYFDAMAVMAACGCRPSELELGVVVSLDLEQQNLIFEIQGTKVTDRNGFKKRVVAIALDSPISRRVKLGLIAAPATALNKSVVRIGRIVFPNRDAITQISPYSFRHEVASDLKYSSGSDEETARALGHKSTNTKSLYARNRGKGGQRLVSVEADGQVRDHGKSELPDSVMQKGQEKRGGTKSKTKKINPAVKISGEL